MKTFNSILVPVDFSKISANAFRYALRLADRLNAEIHLLYGIPPAASTADAGPFAINLLDDLRKDAVAGMEEFIEDEQASVMDQLSKPPLVKSYIKVGDLAVVIQDHIEVENNTLIIMGTHGYQDGWDKLLGTNTTALLGRMPCPMIVIPKDFPYRELNSLCYATDLKHADAFQADNLLTALLPFKPEVNFVHIRQQEEEPEFGLSSLRKMFDRPGSGIKTSFVSINRDDVVDGLFGYARENGADMVVMARPERNWLSRIFIKSHTKDAVKYASLPLMILSSGDLVE